MRTFGRAFDGHYEEPEVIFIFFYHKSHRQPQAIKFGREKGSKAMQTVLIIECMYCKCFLGVKEGGGNVGITSGVCDLCLDLHHPSIADQVREVCAKGD